MKRSWAALASVVGVGLLAAGCCSRGGKKGGTLFGPSFELGTPVLVPVVGDKPTEVVHAPSSIKNAIVYLHGRCTDPAVDLARIAQAAGQHGTILAPQGDEACPGGKTFIWTTNVAAIQPRIDHALQAVTAARGGALESVQVTLMGYSEGAARAEQLAHAYPTRYPRVILIGAPTAPTAANLAGARAVALMAGQKDRQDLMKIGLQSLEHAGKPARFFELPGADHGEFGPDGPRVVGEALDFVAQH